MKKNLLVERFQQLAGIKSLNEGNSYKAKEDLYYIKNYDGEYVNFKDEIIPSKEIDNLSSDEPNLIDKLIKGPKLKLKGEVGIENTFFKKGDEIGQREGDDFKITTDNDNINVKYSDIKQYIEPLSNINEYLESDNDQSDFILALNNINTYDLEANIKEYLVNLYNEEGFGIASDKMVAIERALEQARDQFDKAD